MKTFAFIVIDKSNMSTLRHFPTAERAATFTFSRSAIHKNFIFIKNEKTAVDLSRLEGVGGSPIDIHKKLLQILLDA